MLEDLGYFFVILTSQFDSWRGRSPILWFHRSGWKPHKCKGSLEKSTQTMDWILQAHCSQFFYHLPQTFVPKHWAGTVPAFVQHRSSLTFLSLRMKRVRRSQKRVAASPVHTRMITSMLDFSSEPAGERTATLEMCPKSLKSLELCIPPAWAHLGFWWRLMCCPGPSHWRLCTHRAPHHPSSLSQSPGCCFPWKFLF